MRLELVQVCFLVHVQLGVCGHLGDALCTLLNTTVKKKKSPRLQAGLTLKKSFAVVKAPHLHLPQRSSQLFGQFGHFAGLVVTKQTKQLRPNEALLSAHLQVNTRRLDKHTSTSGFVCLVRH